MRLIDLLSLYDGHVCFGAEYQWDCFPDARFCDFDRRHFGPGSNDFASCVYNKITFEIYEATVTVMVDGNEDGLNYRWLNPNYKEAFVEEAKRRGINPAVCYDNVMYIDIESEDEFKAIAYSAFVQVASLKE